MKNRKINCLDTLITKNQCLQEIVDFMVDSKLAKADEFQQHTRQFEIVKFIHERLLQKEKDGDLLVYNYEWALLPLHQIKLTLVTQRLTKEFLYGY